MRNNSSAWPQAVIVALQQRLASRGLYQGALDGRVGDGTLRAVDALAAGAKGK
jgi:hypothetical protein